MTTLEHRLLASTLDPGPQPTLVHREGMRWGPLVLTIAAVVAALLLFSQVAG